MLDKINWGMIGCGSVTEVKSGPALSKIKDSQLVAVMGRDSKRVSDYAARHHIHKWFTNADDLISDPKVNAIYIATPPESHSIYAIKAMKAGKPVYVEKPMSGKYQECKEMIRINKETGTPLYVAYYRRALPYFLKIKEIIDSGKIGEPKTISVVLHQKPRIGDNNKQNPPWRVIPEISGGGYFYDLASHQLDYLDFLFGEIIESKGITSNQAGLYVPEDNVQAVFKFKNNVMGSGNWCFSSAKNLQKDQTIITGAKGSIEFSFFAGSPIKLITEKNKSKFRIKNTKHIQQPLLEIVVKSLRGIGVCPSDGESAARTNRVMEKIIYNKENF